MSQSSRVSFAQSVAIAAALQIQFTREFSPAWLIGATVTAFQPGASIPARYWIIRIQDDIREPGAAGYHTDANGRPFALVQTGRTLDDTSLTCSHEALEMILDPFGNELVEGDAPVARLGRVEFLREACDPPEADRYAHRINGILVSDFIMPDFYAATGVKGARYSYGGNLKAPRSILPGGYISFRDSRGQWWQQTWFSGSKAIIAGPFNWRLGADGRKTWREHADAEANKAREKLRRKGAKLHK